MALAAMFFTSTVFTFRDCFAAPDAQQAEMRCGLRAAFFHRAWHLAISDATQKEKGAAMGSPFCYLAEWTGLEPATPGVTGRYSNQLNYHSWQEALQLWRASSASNLATLRGFEPRYSP